MQITSTCFKNIFYLLLVPLGLLFLGNKGCNSGQEDSTPFNNDYKQMTGQEKADYIEYYNNEWNAVLDTPALYRYITTTRRFGVLQREAAYVEEHRQLEKAQLADSLSDNYAAVKYCAGLPASHDDLVLQITGSSNWRRNQNLKKLAECRAAVNFTPALMEALQLALQNSYTQEAALTVLDAHRPQGYQQLITEVLVQGRLKYNVLSKACSLLAQQATPYEAYAYIKRTYLTSLNESNSGAMLESALLMADSGTPAIQNDLGAYCIRRLQQDGLRQRYADVLIHGAAHYGDAEALPLLKDFIELTYSPEAALYGIARLQGEDAYPTLKPYFEDESYSLAQLLPALSEMYGGSNNLGVIKSLAEWMNDRDYLEEEDLKAAAIAIQRIGGEAALNTAILNIWADNQVQQLKEMYAQYALPPDTIIADLKVAGIVDAAYTLPGGSVTGATTPVLYSTLQQAGLLAEVEDHYNTPPLPYDAIAEQLFAQLEVPVDVKAYVLYYKDDTYYYEEDKYVHETGLLIDSCFSTFTTNDEVYDIEVEMDLLVLTLNTALRCNGLQERIIPLATGNDHLYRYIYTQPGKLKLLEEKYGFEMEALEIPGAGYNDHYY